MMRLEGRGLIDRATPIHFTFDAREFTGFAGDTLASALLAAGVRLVGRSFKYHRPRGLWSTGTDEPNAIFSIGVGPRETPNIPATVQEIWPGLSAKSQNRWPSLRRDVLAVNDLFHPLLAPGFYYKTFMWPRGAWERCYEPLIRRAAGLGALPDAPSPGRSEKAFAFCDVLVIGGGPAGLAAALASGRAGKDVIVADEADRLGGRLLLERERVGDAPGHGWAETALRELEAMPNVRLMQRTTVTGAYDQGTYAALERVGWHLPPTKRRPVECFWRIVAPRAILATGATERAIAFAGNDRPGVMSAAAVRGYLHRWGVAAGRRVVIFGCNDDVGRTADDLIDAGIEVAAIVDPRAQAAAHPHVPVHQGVVRRTMGRLGIEAVLVAGARGERRLEADCVAVAGGWTPALHLSCHLGGRPRWDERIAAPVPGGGLPAGMVAAGAVRGIFGTAGCLADGMRAAAEAVEAPPIKLPEATGAGGWTITPLWRVEGRGRAFLDMQNDVTVKDVEAAVAEGMSHPEHLKRWTTQGMGSDQGRSSNVTALGVLAEATGRSVADLGLTTFRPPYTPIPIAAMGAGGRGRGFAPVRLLPTHAAARARGAVMVEAGPWLRPSHFPRAGDRSWRDACDREVETVRHSVGVTDLSSLGKFELGGRDAAAFLDFVYARPMSTLAEGRIRYGAMLREDGHVMDDGTCARLGPERWLLTTTTAAAEQVHRHLEFAHQCLRPGLALRIADATDHWAQFGVAGPQARELLSLVLEELPEVPFMGWAEVRVAGLAARLFRVSFSGELGFELAVPRRWGASLWRILVAQAEGLGGGPYGLEALDVLRIEKGFLTHREIDGRTTASDLGLTVGEGCIGAAASGRPGLRGAERHQLVGLVSDLQIRPGAPLFPPGAPLAPQHIEGYVTSGCWSPTFRRWLALALVRNGRARHGEFLHMGDQLRRFRAECLVGPACTYDPTGARMRGAA